jgi:hypothetical protein
MESLLTWWGAYLNWGSTLPAEARWYVWGGACVLVLVYIVVEKWGQPWMDDFEDNDFL